MFRLTTEEIDSAKAAIDHHGYATLLPTPPEWRDLTEHWQDVRSHIGRLDLDDYKPHKPIVVTAAKNEWSVRHVHLLHPLDLLIYTALTSILKQDVEATRAPRTKDRSFSYRASKKKGRLYKSTKTTYRRYIKCLERKSSKSQSRAVAVTDVADFYASISHARLRDLLRDAALTQRSAKALELLISPFATGFMARSGLGIPTGPMASRLLAEVLLNDIDTYLVSKEVDFVRWVDDLNIFAPSLSSAKEIVLDLARWLYETLGLTPQASKTRFLNVETYRKDFLQPIEDRLDDKRELLAQSLFDHEYVLDDDDLEEVKSDAQVVTHLEMLADAMPDGGRVDYRVVGFAVRGLRRTRLHGVGASEVLEVLVENIDRLVPVIDAVAQLLIVLLAETTAPKRIARDLFRSLSKAKVSHHATWMLTILGREPRWSFTRRLVEVYRSAECDAVRRFAALAIAQSGGSFRLERTEFEAASPLVRLALLRTQTKAERKGLPLRGVLERAVAGPVVDSGHLDSS